MADGFLLVGFRYEFADLFRGCGVCVVVVYYAGDGFCGVLYVWFWWIWGGRLVCRVCGLALILRLFLVTKQFVYGLVGVM